METQKAKPSRKAWWQLSAVALAVVVLASACTLNESLQYITKSGATGVRVIFRAETTNDLQLLSTVASLTNPDDAMKHYGITETSCSNMWGTQARGDQCAFRVVQHVHVSGGLLDAYRHVWEEATGGGELSDFVNDSMKLTRKGSNYCISVWVNVFTWSADWGRRSYSESNECIPVSGSSWVKQQQSTQRHEPGRPAVQAFRPAKFGFSQTRRLAFDQQGRRGQLVSTGGGWSW